MLSVSRTVCVIVFLVILTAGNQPSKSVLTPFRDPVTMLYGYKDTQDRIAIPPQFDHANAFSEHGVANVVLKFQATTDHTKEEWYFCRINERGHILEQAFFFDNGWDYYEEGLARYVHNGKVGFSNERAEHVIQARFDMAFPFRNGLAPVCNGCKQSMVEECSPCNHYEYVGGQWGVIDKSGSVLVPFVHKSSTEALKAFYLSDQAPENSWVESDAIITKVSYDAQRKVWHYESKTEDGRFVYAKGISKRELRKGQSLRMKYVAKDIRVKVLVD